MEDQSIQFHFEMPIQIRFNDIDPMGHVNNATLQEYFDLGRMQYLNIIFEGRLQHEVQTLIIASNHTDFFIPVFLTDEIKVQTKVTELGNKSLKMVQLITSKDGSVKVKCNSVMVCFRKDNHESQIIPQHWRDKFIHLEKGDLK